jgi:hypothetical protein
MYFFKKVASKSLPWRYYAGEWSCDCDCPGCSCRRYYACWDCKRGRCLSQAAYECARGDYSFFNEKRQVCAWEQPRPLPFGCPPRPPGPPKPPGGAVQVEFSLLILVV